MNYIDIDLEIDIEEINEERKKVAEHWQDYKRLPSPAPIGPDQSKLIIRMIIWHYQSDDYDDDATMLRAVWRRKCREML